MEENKNKNKEIESQIGYKRLNLKAVGIFENDAKIIFIFKKTEKLASAIYMITSFMSDNEPIKWKTRDAATRLMPYSINLSNKGHRNRADAMNNFISTSLEIISLLDIANISGIISSMNYGILRFEIENMIELVDLKERGLNSKFLLSKNFFETKEDNLTAQSKQREEEQSFGLKDIKIPNGQVFSNISGIPTADYYKGHKFIKDIKKEEKSEMSFNKGHSAKGNRYEAIINLLKNTKEISVKDVSNIISDCSEKTIQRELLNLVGKGVLKKEGERRWSKYSLAS